MTGQQQPGDHHDLLSSLKRFYRGTIYQAIILGLVSFTQPGIWDALNSLGAGGLASPTFVNAANVITYVIMIITCPLWAIAGNRWDLKWVLVAGTLGYTPYFAALYCNSVYDTQWFLILGAVTCGISAAALWVSEAAIAVGYPEPERRGVFIATWMALNKIGSLSGNSIQLATNMNADGRRQGSINPKTYLILVGLSCAGLPLSLTLSKAKDLVRKTKQSNSFERLSDSTSNSDINPKATTTDFTIKGSISDLWTTMKMRHILILLPVYITIRWSGTYQGMYLTEYFTVRGRVLAGFISTVLGIIATLLWGLLLDGKDPNGSSFISRISRRWLTTLQKRGLTEKVVLDISDSGYAKAIVAYCLYSFGSNASVVWTYWILGTYDNQVNKLAYSTATLRSAESLGFAISYGIGATPRISLMTNLIVSCVVFWIGVPFTTYAAWNVRRTAMEDDISSSSIISGTNGQDGHESDEDPLIE
ncbi:Major facilitator superfamily domain, general substrate transporter [Penicillium occitanis (nom. inval.)]|nr:Major facilitator superfamily domain, general substrate transporter [Penicillium occitanis (nom. inval.)]PCG95897.1 hypothetical protein PENOC_075410 [Penicillium occitanis (nom. inval.)]